MAKQQADIIIDPGVNIWPQELETAQAYAMAGKSVHFVRKSNVQRERSADAIIDGILWEMKAPKADNLRAVDRNVRRALKQSKCVIIDSRRMKHVTDMQVERKLRSLAAELRSLQRLQFVNRKREVVDIK